MNKLKLHILYISILILIICCKNNDSIENNLIDESVLFEQHYPDNLASFCFSDYFQEEVSNELPFFYENIETRIYTKCKPLNVKSLTYIKYDYYGVKIDTNFIHLEYDKFGNLMFEKGNIDKNGVFYRYIFSKDGKPKKWLKFNEKEQLHASMEFFYNLENQIEWVKIIEKNVLKDSIEFVYNPQGKIIKAGNKTLKYDKNGNCLEWFTSHKKPICGNIVTQWKGNYDQYGNLIEEWDDQDYINYLKSLKLDENSITYDSLFSNKNELIEIKQYNNKRLLSKINYEYW